MKLPGIAFLLVGILIAVASLKLPGMRFFFYIGLAFIAFGVFKLLVRFILRDKGQQFRKMEASAQSQKMRVCPRCHANAAAFQNFCFDCGMRLR